MHLFEIHANDYSYMYDKKKTSNVLMYEPMLAVQ